MKKQPRFVGFAAATLLILILTLVSPIAASADDGTPPPDESSSGEVADDPVGVADAATPGDVDTPSAAETPAAEAAGDDPAPTEDVTVAEILDAAPEGTEIVVLDENGEALPLASEEAAQVITSSDPIWCPVGFLPGAAECSSEFATPQDLIDDMDLSNPNNSDSVYEQDGVIYFTADPGGAFILTPGSGDELQASDYNTLKFYDLTLQGGWNGLSGVDFALSGQSTFDGVPVKIGQNGNPWEGNITIKDILITDTSDTGLIVFTTGDISLDNVDSQGNEARGARLLNDYTDGDVAVHNSSFNDNEGTGLRVVSYGNITLSDVTAEENGNRGARLTNEDGQVSVQSGSFSLNSKDGLLVESYGDITLMDVTANENGRDGADVYAGTIDIRNSHFDGNEGVGLTAFGGAPDTISLNNVTASENGFGGALLFSLGRIEVSDSQFNNNGYAEGCEGEFCGCEDECECDDFFPCLFGLGLPSGLGLVAVNGDFILELETGSDIVLNNVTANSNALNGALLISSGDITVTGSQFNDNGSQAELDCDEDSCYYFDPFSGTGLAAIAFSSEAETIPQITLNQVVANNNFGGGAILLGDDIVVMNSTFDANGRFPEGYEEYLGYDLWADGLLAGDIFFSSVTIQCSQANNNAGYGFEIITGDVTLAGVTASGNGFDSFSIEADTVTTYDADCADDGGGEPHTPPVVIPVTGGEGFLIDCANPEDFIALLDNGDRARFSLLCGYDGVLSESPLEELPQALPEEYQYLSGMTVSVLDGGSSLEPLPDGASVTPSFQVTDPEAEYAILYWNGSEWIELEGHMTDDGFFEASTNFTGTFVLVSK